MYDIPMIMWLYRRREVAFIAKRELSRGIPSVSYALRTLGSAIIDRKDTKQAVEAIEELGHRKERQKQVACIFPEGTRARDGVMRRFRSTGLLTMVRSMPTACIQPVVVDGNWELLRYKFLPVPVFTRIRLELLDPIEPSHYSSTELVEVVERTIRGRLGQLQEAKAGTAA
jgi:1-acyl-sn-glycerol-3-phosphate acyltransferase